MKETTGELNMTVVTVVAIAALVAFFYLLIWPTLKVSMSLTSACNSAGQTGDFTSGNEAEEHITCAQGTCTYFDEDGNQVSTKSCSGYASDGATTTDD